MDKTTLTALRKSIKHWERLAAGKARPDEYTGRHFCDLCQLFNNNQWSGSNSTCEGCPVFKKTGRKYCVKTPFEQAEELLFTGAVLSLPKSRRLKLPKFLALAKEELKFLRSLLPKPVKK